MLWKTINNWTLKHQCVVTETILMVWYNLLKISTWKASVLDLTEINETPVVSRIGTLHRNALIVEPYVLWLQQCILRCRSHS